jgi:hypothetical protein
MTAALNLGLLGNNVNTSGQVSLTAGVAGTLPVANGGIGTTTLTANNVLLGNGTSAPQVVAPGASGNVLTSNGTTWTSTAPSVSTASVLTATAGATIGAVGTYVFAAYTTTASVTPGNTVAGSLLRYGNDGVQVPTSLNMNSGGSTGSATALSGTWRLMGGGFYSGFGCPPLSGYILSLWLRIS